MRSWSSLKQDNFAHLSSNAFCYIGLNEKNILGEGLKWSIRHWFLTKIIFSLYFLKCLIGFELINFLKAV